VREVEVEVDMEGFRMFRNLDLKLKDRGLVGLLVVVALVLVLSLLENLDLFLKEEGFRERDLMVGLGRGVDVVSSELEFSWATGSSTGAGWFLLLLARRENREFREASDLEELELRDLVDTEAAWDLGFSFSDLVL